MILKDVSTLASGTVSCLCFFVAFQPAGPGKCAANADEDDSILVSMGEICEKCEVEELFPRLVFLMVGMFRMIVLGLLV